VVGGGWWTVGIVSRHADDIVLGHVYVLIVGRAMSTVLCEVR
jgi:hypothetical protein